MTLTQLRDAVRVRLGVPASDNFFTDATLTDLINEAVQTYSVEFDWPWLEATTTFATVANQEGYAVPADWVRTQVLTPPDDYPLRYISLNELRQRNEVGGLFSAQFPDSYTVAQDQIKLSPIPQSVRTYTHDYIKAEPTLSGASDTPLCPAQFQYIIVAKACALGYMRQNEMERAMGWERQYDKWLMRMRDNRKRTTAFTQIRVRPGSMI